MATVRPGTLPAYFGEGSSLYAAGLGTVSLCPSPTYLLQAADAQQPQLLDLDKLDQRLMYGQILALARTIGTLVRARGNSLAQGANQLVLSWVTPCLCLVPVDGVQHAATASPTRRSLWRCAVPNSFIAAGEPLRAATGPVP